MKRLLLWVTSLMLLAGMAFSPALAASQASTREKKIYRRIDLYGLCRR